MNCPAPLAGRRRRALALTVVTTALAAAVGVAVLDGSDPAPPRHQALCYYVPGSFLFMTPVQVCGEDNGGGPW